VESDSDNEDEQDVDNVVSLWKIPYSQIGNLAHATPAMPFCVFGHLVCCEYKYSMTSGKLEKFAKKWELARVGLLFGAFRCTVCHIGGALWKTPSIMNGISPNFYGMLVWWGYTIYHTIFWFDKFFCPIRGAFWKRVLSHLLDIAGTVTWAKLQLSLWNFSIMLAITRAWMGNCYSAHFDVWFVKTQKLITPSIMNGILQNFYCMLIWWGLRVHNKFLFELYVLLLNQNHTWPTLEFTPTAGACS
jgi:hypothetical protein